MESSTILDRWQSLIRLLPLHYFVTTRRIHVGEDEIIKRLDFMTESIRSTLWWSVFPLYFFQKPNPPIPRPYKGSSHRDSLPRYHNFSFSGFVFTRRRNPGIRHEVRSTYMTRTPSFTSPRSVLTPTILGHLYLWSSVVYIAKSKQN